MSQAPPLVLRLPATPLAIATGTVALGTLAVQSALSGQGAFGQRFELTPYTAVLILAQVLFTTAISAIAFSRRRPLVCGAVLVGGAVIGGLAKVLVSVFIIVILEVPPWGSSLGRLGFWLFSDLLLAFSLLPVAARVRQARPNVTPNGPIDAPIDVLSAAAAWLVAVSLSAAFVSPYLHVLLVAAMGVCGAAFLINQALAGERALDEGLEQGQQGLSPARRFARRIMRPLLTIGLFTLAGGGVAALAVHSEVVPPPELTERYDHYRVSQFEGYAIEGLSLWRVEQGPGLIVGFDEERRSVVADKELFARLRGLSPDELADRANEMMNHSYCCVVHEAWAPPPGASADDKPPSDEGDVIGPPRVEQGTLIFWRTADGKATGTNPTRFTFSLEPGAVR